MAVYTKIVSFIKAKEGGLSSATTDTASNNPSNCGNGSNGRPYHTNKGVTWSTFKGLSSKLGYSATCDNFKKMPDDIWGKIYKDGYWNPMQGDRIKNQAIANTFVEMVWGSGIGSVSRGTGAVGWLNSFFKKNYNQNLTSIHHKRLNINKHPDIVLHGCHILLLKQDIASTHTAIDIKIQRLNFHGIFVIFCF